MFRHIFLPLFFMFAFMPIKAQVLSFEKATDLGKWWADKGSITQSSDKVKLGDYSLRWDTNNGKILSGNNLSGLKNVSEVKSGGVCLYIYNTKATNATLRISFLNYKSTRRYIDFNMNFVGWRVLWARFYEDMVQVSTGTFNSIQFDFQDNGEVPPVIYLDCLEFTNNVFWGRTPDLQCRTLHGNKDGNLPNWDTPLPQIKKATSEQLEGINKIQRRVDEWFLGNGKNNQNDYYKMRLDNLKRYVSMAKMPEISASGTVNKSGLFNYWMPSQKEGVNLNKFGITSAKILQALAFDYRLNNNSARKQEFSDLMEWYYDQGWAAGSGLGTLQHDNLRDVYFYLSLYIMRDVLPEALFNNAYESFKWYAGVLTRFKRNTEFSGCNSDEIRTKALPTLEYILMEKDPDLKVTMLSGFSEFLKNALDYGTGYSDPFKPDGSLYHHRAPYMSAYGSGALYFGCLMWYLLYDTPFQLDEATYERLKMLLLSFRFVCGNYAVSAGISGRFPSSSTQMLHELLPAFAYLATTSPSKKIDVDLQRAFLRLWKPDENPLSDFFTQSNAGGGMEANRTLGEIDALLSLVEASTEGQVLPEENPVGPKFMPYSGLLVYRRPNWMLSIKGYSKYIWDYEREAYENRYIGYGYAEYTNFSKNNYCSYNPQGWDWQFVPGTTASTFQVDKNKIRHRNLSDQPFLGGIGFKPSISMFTNRLHDVYYNPTFYADKSYFIVDDVIYCMGSGISCQTTGQNTVNTTLFQNYRKIPFLHVTTIDDKSIIDNVGNSFIINDDSNKITYTQTSSGYHLGYITHGKNPKDAKYNYTWLMDNKNMDSISYYKNQSPFEVLEQSSNGHIVWHKKRNVLFASVFKSGNLSNAKILTFVSKPMMAVIQKNGSELDIAFSNPDMDRPSAPGKDMSALQGDDVYATGRKTSLTFVLDGEYRKNGGDDLVSVHYDTAKNQTTISHPSTHDGETYKVSLLEGATDVDSITEQSICVVRDHKGFHISSLTPYSVTVLDVFGRVQHHTASLQGDYFLKTMHLHGFYVLKIQSQTETIVHKVIL